MDAIRKYFWLYLAFFFLMMILFHACMGAIDTEARQYMDKIESHHTETRQAYYATERN